MLFNIEVGFEDFLQLLQERPQSNVAVYTND